MRLILLYALTLLLSGCLEQAASRVSFLVLMPFVLIFVVLWLLNRNRDGGAGWDESHYPDKEEEEENEDHHLM